jgi:hypothetical protein
MTGKDLRAIITRSDEDFVHLWFLGEDNYPLEEMPSLPISEGVYKDSLTFENFSFSWVKLEPTDKWDGKLEMLDDFGKFEFHIKDIQFYQISEDDETPKNIHDAIEEGEFWDLVQSIANEEKIFEKTN